MTERITPRQFHQAEGVEDWRVLGNAAYAYFRTRSFATGVLLVNTIGELAERADHHPDIDLRYGGVTVRLLSHDVHGPSERDTALARQISAAARDLDIPAEPSKVQEIGLTIEAVSGTDVLPFWRAVLGHRPHDEAELQDPRRRGPTVRFQPSHAERPRRNRVHVDVFVPHDQAEARVAAGIEAGGQLIGESDAPSWWTLADAEGNEVDIATWRGRD